MNSFALLSIGSKNLLIDIWCLLLGLKTGRGRADILSGTKIFTEYFFANSILNLSVISKKHGDLCCLSMDQSYRKRAHVDKQAPRLARVKKKGDLSMNNDRCDECQSG